MMPRPSGVIYIGIDPGASGGLAIIRGGSVKVIQMPKTDRDLWDWFGDTMSCGVVAVLEKVGGYVHGNPAPGSAMFNFGVNYGLLRMALTASSIPFEEVTPQKWQKALSIPHRKKAETRTQWKNRLKQKAQQLFPDVKVTLSTCDALLIAEFCRRKHKGNPPGTKLKDPLDGYPESSMDDL